MRERIAIAAAITGLVVSISAAPGPQTDAVAPRALVSGSDESSKPPVAPAIPARPDRSDPVALHAFASCGEFVGHVRARAAEIVGPHGLTGGDYWGFGVEVANFSTSSGMGALPGLAPRPVTLDMPGFSTTNVQVGGVDEPDIVKTDGHTIFWLGERTLHAVAVNGDGLMREAGALRIRGWDPKMLLAGERLLVLSQAWSAKDLRPGSVTRLTTVDVSDPDAMQIVSTTDLEGSYVSARLIDGTVRLVIRSEQPRNLGFRGPRGGTGPDITAAIQRNQRVIKKSPAEAWLPQFSITQGGTRSTRELVSCTAVYTPKAFTGLDFVSVVTLDPARPESQHTASIIGGGDTVYATAEQLFVATTQVVAASNQRRFNEIWKTQIHSFDITDPSGARYRASGEVEGQLKDQWALDFHDGHLRVATTLGVPWEESSESAVTVLEENDGYLTPVGRVGDLGRRGEQIYAVRFIGDVGYVVTFRLIDPLYTIDLSDPANPKVLGELKIPGYSAYLHPVDEGLLLGIGQSASARGITRGAQVSLFDVSDPSDPQRIDQLSFKNGNSEAEFDHHAFLYWPATGSLVVPLTEYDTQSFVGAVGIRVKDRTLTEIARVSHQRGTLEQLVMHVWRAQIRRSVVVGNTLFTLSDQGMLASDLETFEERGWLGWDRTLHRVRGFVGREPGSRDGWGHRARLRAPGQIALGYRAEIWIADTGNAAVRRVRWDSVQTQRIRNDDGTTSTHFPQDPIGIAPAPKGRLFVATPCALWLVKSRLDAGRPNLVAGDCGETGKIFGPADGVGSGARFGSLGQIARAPDGSVLVVDKGAHAIRRVVVDQEGVGTVTTVAGSLGRSGHVDGPGSQARFTEPSGITVLPSGDVLVTDTGNHVVRRLAHGSWHVATVAGVPGRPSESARDGRLTSPVAIAFDAVTERIYVTGAHRITTIRGGSIRTVAGNGTAGMRGGAPLNARFRSPAGLLVAGGSLIVADTGNHRLRWIR